MMLRAHFAIPGDLSALTGGYGYDREVLARARLFDVDLAHVALPGGFPAPSRNDLAVCEEILRALPRDEPLIIDGLAFGVFSADLLKALPRNVIALVHHPLALETGVSAERAAQLQASEQAALSHAREIVVTSATTRDLLVADYAVPASRIAIAMPGTDRAPRALPGVGAPRLLCVGSVVPRKGYDVLVDALAELTALDWSLTIVGALTRAPAHAAGLSERIKARNLSDRISLSGEVSAVELERLYASSDVFVMPSLFEGYGMVLGEAMARGLPIVATTGGAAAQTVPDGAALKVPPGDVPALREALRRMIGDADLRQRMAEFSYGAGQSLPTWDDTARIVAETVRRAARGDVS